MCKLPLQLFLLLIVFHSCADKGSTGLSTSQKNSTPDTKLQEVQDLAEFEVEMTKNKEGLIPSDNLSRLKESLISQNRGPGSNLDLEWTERGPSNVAGRTRTFVVDPNDPTGNTIWAGGVSGGLWKCTNFKSSSYQWEEIKSYPGSPAISDIIFDPLDKQTMFVSTGEGWFNTDAYSGDGIYKSSDNGKTWTYLASTSASYFRYVQKMVIIGSIFYACTRHAGVLFSFDGGFTWFSSLNNTYNGFSDRAADLEFTTSGSIYAAMGLLSEDGIYRTTDGGYNWDYLTFPFTDFERIEFAIAPSNQDKLYALIQNTDDRYVKYVIRSHNGGMDWDTLSAPPAFDMDNFARNQAWYNLAIAIDPVDEDHVIIGAVDLLESFDGGETWQQISQWYGGGGFQYVHADQHRIHFLGSDELLVSNDGGLWYSNTRENNVPVFQSKNNGYNVTQFYTCAVENSTESTYILAGAQDNGTQIFDGEGINSTSNLIGGDGGYCFIDSDNRKFQVAATTYNNYYTTTDNWVTWDLVSGKEQEGFFINPTAYDHTNNVLYSSAEEASINIIEMNNSNIDSLYFPNIGESKISAITVDPYDPKMLLLGTNNGECFRINDINGNPSADKLLDLDFGFIRNIDISSNDENKMILTLSNYDVHSVYHSSNGGQDWISIEGNLPDMPVRWGVFNPKDDKQVLLATEMGVWSTTLVNGEQTQWEIEDNGMPLVRVDMLRFKPVDNSLIAASYGRGLFTSRSLENIEDNDQDGYTSNVDCDDNDPAINPAASEITYNGVDDDCNPLTLDDDLDQDGFAKDEDCDDSEATINPGQQEEVYNGIDDDCNPLTLDDDLDQDGFGNAEDCDDENDHIYPGATDIPNNGIDEDCDGGDFVSSTFNTTQSDFVLFPNPTRDFITVKAPYLDAQYKYRLFEIAGKLVHGGVLKKRIDLSNLTSGVYILKIMKENGLTESQTVVKI